MQQKLWENYTQTEGRQERKKDKNYTFFFVLAKKRKYTVSYNNIPIT